MIGRIRRIDTSARERPAESCRVLGIDPGLQCCGYAVIAWPAAQVCDAGVIRSEGDGALPARLAEIQDGLNDVLAEHAVDLLAVEELYAHYKHPRTAILMGHARGVILLGAARAGVPVVDVPATMIKKALTGNGHASKIQMQRAILATLKLEALPEPADVADAMAVALCAAWQRSQEVRMA